MDHSDQEETALESEALSRLKISSEGIKKTDDTSQADPDVKEGSQQDMVEHSGGDFLANPFPPSGDYCIHISVDQIEGRGRQLPLPYAWNEPLVRDMAKHWMAHEVEEVKLLALGKAILFMGCGTPTIGLTHDEASRCIRVIPIMDHWAGRTVVVAGRPVPWREALKWNRMKGTNWVAGRIDKNGRPRRCNPPKSEGWHKRMLQPERTLIQKRGSSPSAGGTVESPGASKPAKKRRCAYCRQTDHIVEDCKRFHKKRIALNSKGETEMEGTAPPIGKHSRKSGKPQQDSAEIADTTSSLTTEN